MKRPPSAPCRAWPTKCRFAADLFPASMRWHNCTAGVSPASLSKNENVMNNKEIRDKQTAAIELEMKDLQKHLFDLRTQAVTEKLENPSLLRKTRKDIARMKTILRERQLTEKKK